MRITVCFDVEVSSYLYLLKHVLELNQELFRLFSFVRDAAQSLRELTLQNQSKTQKALRQEHSEQPLFYKDNKEERTRLGLRNKDSKFWIN